MCKTAISFASESHGSEGTTGDLVAERRLLRKIFKDIAARSQSQGSSIDSLGFLKCTGLPGLLGEQFFKALDSDRDGRLSLTEFTDGIITLYRGNFLEIASLVFNVLDFGHKGYITWQGLELISRYLPDFCPKCGAKVLIQNDYSPVKSLFPHSQTLCFDETLVAMSQFPGFFDRLLQALTTSLPPVFDRTLLSLCDSQSCARFSSINVGLCPLQYAGRRLFGELRDQALYLYRSVDRNSVREIIVLRGLFAEPMAETEFLLKSQDFQYEFSTNSERSRDLWLERLLEFTHFRWFDDYYETGEILGEGAFGQVIKASHRLTRAPAAVKIINKRPMSKLQELRLRKEMDVLRLAKHPNLVELYDIFESNERVYIVTEYVPGGSLFEFLKKQQFQASPTLARTVVQDLASALRFLHQLGVVHRDIKLENVLLTSSSAPQHAKLIDFGLSTFLGPEDLTQDSVGTLKYVSPEVISLIKYREKVDSWGLGVLLYILLTGKVPFYGKTDEEVALRILKKELVYEGEVWRNVDSEAKRVVKSLLSKRPDQRMNMEEVLGCKWVRG